MKPEIAKTESKQKKSRLISGVVISNKMKDTVVVKVNRYSKHPKYQKYVLKSKHYAAHDPGNKNAIGDKVTIEECRPISKTKHFKVMENVNLKY